MGWGWGKGVVEFGDHIQSTCVFDSSSRSAATVMGVETTDEMCWASFITGVRDPRTGIS